MFIASSSLLLAIAAGCGASGDEMRARALPNESADMKPTLMAPEEDGDSGELAEDVDEHDEYFGEDPLLDGDERVHPVDVLEPQSDLRSVEPTDVEDIDAEHRPQPAAIGDPRLQADPISKPGTIEPRAQP
jgi:hypothetical protein